MKQIWTKEKVWDWHKQHQWVVGFNYVPSSSINLIETWQEDGFEDTFTVMQKEIALAASIGMNSVRMLLPFDVWKHQRESFLNNLERFLDLLSVYSMTLMPIFFDDCGRSPVEFYSDDIKFGMQPEPVPGNHGGYPPTSAIASKDPLYHMADNPKNWAYMERFVKDIVSKYRTDGRILMWDIWNEPGNSGSAGIGNIPRSMKVMEKVFGWIRELRPIQPLTAGCWDFYTDYLEYDTFGELTGIERKALELSDVISFHYYGDYERSVRLIKKLEGYDRPMFITEWLHRPFKNDVYDHLPLFQRKKIGCFNWGLINGKSQTHEPWDWIKDWNLDFSRWQHDLFHSDGTPYRTEEIDLFKELLLLKR